MERYTFNYEVMKDENGVKQLKNVWRMMPPNTEEKKLGKHPTQKPVSLVARCLRVSTNSGDLIVDPFAGSGTTGVAALQLGRNFQGCEREEEYVRLAAKRLSQVTGSPSDDIWPLKAGARC